MQTHTQVVPPTLMLSVHGEFTRRLVDLLATVRITRFLGSTRCNVFVFALPMLHKFVCIVSPQMWWKTAEWYPGSKATLFDFSGVASALVCFVASCTALKLYHLHKTLKEVQKKSLRREILKKDAYFDIPNGFSVARSNVHLDSYILSAEMG